MVKQEYPKWLYSASAPACIVKDQEAHLALGPGWFDSPVKAQAAAEAPAAPPAVVSEAATVVPSVPSVPSEPVTPAAEPASDPDAEAKSLYATNVATVIEKLKGCTPAMLAHVQFLEAQNPRGARKSILEAIDKLLKG